MVWSGKQYKEFLDDITCEYCESNHYCILKEFLISSHPSPRILMQLKAIEKFKYEKSKELKKDIGWNTAIELWVEEGYAKKYADLYEDDIKFSVLYRKIKNNEK